MTPAANGNMRVNQESWACEVCSWSSRRAPSRSGAVLILHYMGAVWNRIGSGLGATLEVEHPSNELLQGALQLTTLDVDGIFVTAL
jgi:hypothetical protein